MEERHLSLSEAADALNISERTAYRWIKSGKLRALMVTAEEHVPTLPDVPTAAEPGVTHEISRRSGRP